MTHAKNKRINKILHKLINSGNKLKRAIPDCVICTQLTFCFLDIFRSPWYWWLLFWPTRGRLLLYYEFWGHLIWVRSDVINWWVIFFFFKTTKAKLNFVSFSIEDHNGMIAVVPNFNQPEGLYCYWDGLFTSEGQIYPVERTEILSQK